MPPKSKSTKKKVVHVPADDTSLVAYGEEGANQGDDQGADVVEDDVDGMTQDLDNVSFDVFGAGATASAGAGAGAGGRKAPKAPVEYFMECPFCGDDVDVGAKVQYVQNRMQAHYKVCVCYEVPAAPTEESPSKITPSKRGAAASAASPPVAAAATSKVPSSKVPPQMLANTTQLRKAQPPAPVYPSSHLTPEDYMLNGWVDAYGDDMIPGKQDDWSGTNSFACKWGCMTTTTRVPVSFRSKVTFLEHIIKCHPDFRIVLETPPSEVYDTPGTRHLVQDLDKRGFN